MFFTAAEKTISFGDWKMRFVAFDCSRRYLYYSECVDCEPTLEGNIKSDNYFGQKNKWKRKIKVTEVHAMTTENRVPVNTIGFRPVDLLQLEFIGEERPIASGEIPPAGPLLHGTTDLSPYDRKLYAIGNENFIKDPFGVTDLYNGLRDLFSTISQDRQVVMAAAAAEGRPVEEPPFATICSPRGKKSEHAAGKRATVILRCRNEREFRRLWYVVQTTLGYDKLTVRPYRGLPPYDPRNGVTFSVIPMSMWHEFKALDAAVFYNFTCGDVVGPTSANSYEVQTLLANVCMFITHDMVYFMRNSGNIPRWIRLQEVRMVQYNITARDPFIAFLCDRPAPDTIFIPRRSEETTYHAKDVLIGLDFKPELQVVRARHVLHDSCMASLAVRRVFTIDETFDHTVQAYVDRQRKAGTPLCLLPGANFASPMSCPLPKEQLAAVWHKVQEQLRATGRLPNSAAIPLYGSTASEIHLNEEQLAVVARRLRAQRSSSTDIVGMSLEEVQRVANENRTPPRPSSLANLDVTSPTVDSLRTPQIAFEEAQRRHQGARLAEEEKRAEREARDMVPSYVYPNARYVTEEEVRTGAAEEAPREHHVEIADYSFTAGPEHNLQDLMKRSKLAFGVGPEEDQPASNGSGRRSKANTK